MNILSQQITIVSGLPRSGTSLMMQMLAAGGLPSLTDGERTSDESNPRGYYEFELVKRLRTDRSWLPQAQGRVVKIIHLLLRELPVDGQFQYRVLLMKRPIEEILASQRTMLQRAGKAAAADAVLEKVFLTQLADVERWLEAQSCFAWLPVSYHEVLSSGEKVAREICDFLQLPLDPAAMAATVDQSLYRQRKNSSAE